MENAFDGNFRVSLPQNSSNSVDTKNGCSSKINSI